MKRKWVGVALLVGAIATGCGSDESGAASEPEVSDIKIAGQVEAPIDTGELLTSAMAAKLSEQFEYGVTPCLADRSVDVRESDQLLVKDADGSTVGTAELAGGVLDPSGDEAPIKSPCVFTFSAVVPGGEEFYSLELGQTTETFSADELQSSVTLDVRP